MSDHKPGDVVAGADADELPTTLTADKEPQQQSTETGDEGGGQLVQDSEEGEPAEATADSLSRESKGTTAAEGLVPVKSSEQRIGACA